MGSDNTALGDRMKWYESRYTDQTFMPLVPVLARLDGKAFHTFTQGLQRPYDERLSRLMTETTKYLVHETNARCGYTQSDEISLVWLAEDWESEIFFAAKLQKMNSVLASMTTAFFNRALDKYLPEKADRVALFDCRVFQVPSNSEASNCFLWREQDATRNSVQMAARAHYSHNECENKNTSDLHEMLFQKSINWNNYPGFFKRGTYVRRRTIDRAFTKAELEELPLKHAARSNPNLTFKRGTVMEENFPPMRSVINRDEVLLFGAEPVTLIEEEEE